LGQVGTLLMSEDASTARVMGIEWLLWLELKPPGTILVAILWRGTPIHLTMAVIV
jgi:hypothetical protein